MSERLDEILRAKGVEPAESDDSQLREWSASEIADMLAADSLDGPRRTISTVTRFLRQRRGKAR